MVDPENIRDIMEWVAPKNVDEVRSYMEFLGYHGSSRTSHRFLILLHHCSVKLNGQRSVKLVLHRLSNC